MALQTEEYSKISNTFTLELTLVENSTSTAENTSSVSYTLKLKSTTKNFAQYGVGAKVELDGKTVAVRDRGSAPKITLGTYSEVTLLSGTATVGHDSDGDKSMAFFYELDMASASYTPGYVSASGTMDLTQIPRGATITSAPNFNDEDDPVVKVSNPAGVAVQLGIYKTDGRTALAAYRPISGTTYTFQLTNQEREALRKVDVTKNTAQVRFYVKSVVGGQTFISSVARTLTIQNPEPTLSPTVEDVNPDTLALTGESGNLVKYHSRVSVKTGAKAVKGSTLVRQSITCGSLTLTGDGTLEGVEAGNIVISATDSRGNTTTQVVEKKLLGYVHLTCTMGHGIPDASGIFQLEATGACYYGNFGQAENTLKVEYRYRKQGDSDWGEWAGVDSVLPMGFTYLARAKVQGLDYQTGYEFQARATDQLETVTSPEQAVKSQPTFDWSGKDFNFNVPVTVMGHNLAWCGCTAHMGENMAGVSTNVTAPMTVLDAAYGGMKLSNGAICIPEDGLYLVGGQIMVADGAKGLYLGLQINGTKKGVIMDAYVGFSIHYGIIASTPTIAELKSGELVTMIARMSTATNGVTIAGNTRTKLTITKVY